jgi:hypothetical protein
MDDSASEPKWKKLAVPGGPPTQYRSQPLTPMELAFARAVIRARRWPRGHCFRSNQEIVVSSADDWPVVPVPRCPSSLELLYADGLAWAPWVDWTPHAWFTINGKVIDVTWRENRRRVVGLFTHIRYYGVPYKPRVVHDVNTVRGSWDHISQLADVPDEIRRRPLR